MCAEPNASDARYLDGLHKTYVRHQDFPRTQPKDIVSTRKSFRFTFVTSEGACCLDRRCKAVCVVKGCGNPVVVFCHRIGDICCGHWPTTWCSRGSTCRTFNIAICSSSCCMRLCSAVSEHVFCLSPNEPVLAALVLPVSAFETEPTREKSRLVWASLRPFAAFCRVVARKFLGETLRRQSQVHRGGMGREEHGPRPGVFRCYAGRQHAQGDTSTLSMSTLVDVNMPAVECGSSRGQELLCMQPA